MPMTNTFKFFFSLLLCHPSKEKGVKVYGLAHGNIPFKNVKIKSFLWGNSTGTSS